MKKKEMEERIKELERRARRVERKDCVSPWRIVPPCPCRRPCDWPRYPRVTYGWKYEPGTTISSSAGDDDAAGYSYTDPSIRNDPVTLT